MKQYIQPGKPIDFVTYEELASLFAEFGHATHIAFGSDKIEKTLENWPVVGDTRRVRVDNTHGTNNIVITHHEGIIDLLPSNNGRGGLMIMVNYGGSFYLYLSSAEVAKKANGNVATIYVPPNAYGYTWDGRISDQLWVGNISAQLATGTWAFLTMAEI